MGLLTNKDARIYRNAFKEMAKLRGISVSYQYIKDKHMTIHSETNSTYSDPIRMDIIFMENPSVSTLKKIGWVSEISEPKPIIAILPFDAPNLEIDCRIIIEPYEEIDSRQRVFEITDIKTFLEYPESYTCILAPVYDSLTEPTDLNYSKVNNNFIDPHSEGERAPFWAEDADTTPKEYEKKLNYEWINDNE